MTILIDMSIEGTLNYATHIQESKNNLLDLVREGVEIKIQGERVNKEIYLPLEKRDGNDLPATSPEQGGGENSNSY